MKGLSLSFLRNIRENLVYSSPYIRWIDSAENHPTETRKISVAIPHFERARLIHVTLKNIYKDDRVSEIIVLDDGSNPEQWENTVQRLRPYRSKVRLYRRPHNLGILPTKWQASTLCSNDWCILLDSDNTIFHSYVDTIFDLDSWDANTIYCPGFAYPDLNFSPFGPIQISFSDVQHLGDNQQHVMAMLNDGNYFFNCKAFTEQLQPFLHYQVSAADVIFANYLWLSTGNQLQLLPQASYYHRCHPGSTWIQNVAESLQEAQKIYQRFQERQVVDAGFLQTLSLHTQLGHDASARSRIYQNRDLVAVSL